VDSDPNWTAIDRRDDELGVAIARWATSATDVAEVQGPCEALGMDPTWIVRFRSETLEAEALLFRGAVVDVSASRPGALDVGLLVGGEVNLSDARLIEMLDGLEAGARGGLSLCGYGHRPGRGVPAEPRTQPPRSPNCGRGVSPVRGATGCATGSTGWTGGAGMGWTTTWRPKRLTR